LTQLSRVLLEPADQQTHTKRLFMTHDDYVHRYLQGTGAEIGASEHPIGGISPIYVDKFSEYAGKPCLADYPGEATSLPFYNQSLDYVASSHVFEHLSNPVKALIEWQRVLKPGGYAYLVIPDRRYTFDHARETTEPEHIVEDYLANTDDTDATHIDDFVFGIDWNEITPGLLPEELEEQKKANAAYHHDRATQGLDINIHFHVFEPENFTALMELCNKSQQVPLNMELVEVAERFPEPQLNGFLAILQTPKQTASSLLNKISNRWKNRASSSTYPIDQERLGEFKQPQ